MTFVFWGVTVDLGLKWASAAFLCAFSLLHAIPGWRDEEKMLTRGREKGYDFVAYLNRDSVPFKRFYKIPEAETAVRGSLRYEGSLAFIKAFADAAGSMPRRRNG